jgi:flagellar M-ring protein FliF
MDDANKTPTGWLAASGSRQFAVAAGVLLLLTALIAGAWWLLRSDYQILFGNLREQDAATIVAELERQKLPYRLADGGTTVLVPQSQVHGTRLKVMSKELPLKGTVGFELFNNADLGLTEFAQKVNYQRALQGELARTIMSLAEIDSARVHLSMPDSGLFRRAGAKPRASVALMTKAGQELPADTVRGIQRLVAAAVPELEPHEVTVIDPRGAPMASVARGGEVVSDRRLELKIELEQYYARKLAQQLEPIVGAGNASISVDAQLNFDQVRVTQETNGAAARRLPRTDNGAKTLETVFAVGQDDIAERPRMLLGADSPSRRLEQIVASPGSLKRLNVGVLLQSAVDAVTLEQVRQLVVATAGLSTERGDAVVVFARDKFAAQDKGTALAQPASLQLSADGTPAQSRPVNNGRANSAVPSWVIGFALLALLCAGGIAWWLLQQRNGSGLAMMTAAQRERQLQRLREALAAGGVDARR